MVVEQVEDFQPNLRPLIAQRVNRADDREVRPEEVIVPEAVSWLSAAATRLDAIRRRVRLLTRRLIEGCDRYQHSRRVSRRAWIVFDLGADHTSIEDVRAIVADPIQITVAAVCAA